MTLKDYYKTLLSEAYEKRLKRLETALPKANKRVEDKFGTADAVELGDMGHLD